MNRSFYSLVDRANRRDILGNTARSALTALAQQVEREHAAQDAETSMNAHLEMLRMLLPTDCVSFAVKDRGKFWEAVVEMPTTVHRGAGPTADAAIKDALSAVQQVAHQVHAGDRR